MGFREICRVPNVTVANISTCLNGIFTADVTVTFTGAPQPGALIVTGDNIGAVSVSTVGLSSPHTFTNVSFLADGTVIDITAELVESD